jgi:hypothetical protein
LNPASTNAKKTNIKKMITGAQSQGHPSKKDGEVGFDSCWTVVVG